MRYENVCIESLGYVFPAQVLTSAEIEAQLQPLYRRLRLPEGRLELMSGIRQRRLWEPGTVPSDVSVQSGEHALNAAGIDRKHVGALIHGSVCRDHLEPATACRVHQLLKLPSDAVIYDVSNACLGVLNGMVQVANMIELGQIEAGLIVGTESSRQLVETTIDYLNSDTTLTRSTVKPAVASLTIGSASCAVLLVHRRLSSTYSRLHTATTRANTAHHLLCRSGRDEAVLDGMQPLMNTDSETLMRAGVETGAATFDDFLDQANWSCEDVDKTCCHQVGSAHRKHLLETLGLSSTQDFITYPWLGNTGAAALPVTMALAAAAGHFLADDHVGLLGIGSGINCLMLGMDWQTVNVAGEDRSPQAATNKSVDVTSP